MVKRMVNYPYFTDNRKYCIEIWYNEEIEYYYFNSFEEAKEQYLMWCDNKYIENSYKKKEIL